MVAKLVVGANSVEGACSRINFGMGTEGRINFDDSAAAGGGGRINSGGGTASKNIFGGGAAGRINGGANCLGRGSKATRASRSPWRCAVAFVARRRVRRSVKAEVRRGSLQQQLPRC